MKYTQTKCICLSKNGNEKLDYLMFNSLYILFNLTTFFYHGTLYFNITFILNPTILVYFLQILDFTLISVHYFFSSTETASNFSAEGALGVVSAAVESVTAASVLCDFFKSANLLASSWTSSASLAKLL